jgi:GNAT superfamily N-acetyltransferase
MDMLASTFEGASLMHDIDDAPRPREHAYEIADLYESSFGPDPEVPVSVFAESLTKHAECAGFRCRLAYRDETAAGFAYGFTAFTGDPPSPWYARVRDVAGADWIEGNFGLAWFGVAPAHQRRGIGSSLLESTLAGLSHRRAWLVTRADDEPLRVFYRRRGWVDVAEDELGSDTLRVVMGRALRG